MLIKDLEQYCREIHRKHFPKNNVRVFTNPSSKNGVYVVYSNMIKTIAWTDIKTEKASFYTVLRNFSEYQDAQY